MMSWANQCAAAPEELAPPCAVAPALLGFTRDADGCEFIAVAVQPAGQALAERAGIELVGLALAIERDGGDEKRLRPGGHQFPMQHETEPATFLYAEDLATFGHPALDLGDEFRAGELARGLQAGVTALGHGRDGFQMHVQSELEHRLDGIKHGPGQRLARGQHNGLVEGGGAV